METATSASNHSFQAMCVTLWGAAVDWSVDFLHARRVTSRLGLATARVVLACIPCPIQVSPVLMNNIMAHSLASCVIPSSGRLDLFCPLPVAPDSWFILLAAVVRNVTASLSCTLAERLRISGTWALKGLPSYWSDSTPEGQQTEADRKFAQAGYRLNIRARLLLIRSYVAINTAVNRALLATLYVFGQPVVLY